MEEGGEIKNCIQVWLTVLVCLCYCYKISKITTKGLTRLLTILPIVCLFLVLPLYLNSIHLGGPTAFFIAWLANFKLLLFAFGKGPLSSDPSISLGHFIAVGCLPIKIHQQHPTQKTGSKPQMNGGPSPKIYPKPQNNGVQSEIEPNKQHPRRKTTKNGSKSLVNYAIKFMLLAMLLRVYGYRDHMHPKLIMILYCCHIYFCLEILLALVATMARTLLGLELEPQFNEPYLSTSLQDFWGRRWNIMVTRILRPSVYEPVLCYSTKLVGRRWAPLPAVLSTFVASGVMHELIFYYLGRSGPTLGVTWFFLLHGVCLMAEIALKKVINGRYRLHPVISGFLAVGFIMTTALWLFVPQLLRCKTDDRGFDERAFGEYAAIGAFVKRSWSHFEAFKFLST